jgi:hypothetical protein
VRRTRPGRRQTGPISLPAIAYQRLPTDPIARAPAGAGWGHAPWQDRAASGPIGSTGVGRSQPPAPQRMTEATRLHEARTGHERAGGFLRRRRSRREWLAPWAARSEGSGISTPASHSQGVKVAKPEAPTKPCLERSTGLGPAAAVPVSTRSRTSSVPVSPGRNWRYRTSGRSLRFRARSLGLGGRCARKRAVSYPRSAENCRVCAPGHSARPIWSAARRLPDSPSVRRGEPSCHSTK